MITLAIDRDHVSTGEFLTGSVHWSAAATERLRRVTVRIEWETRGHGNDVYCAAREVRWECEERDVEKSFPLRMLVPHEGPVTYSGFILNIGWKVIATAVIRGGDDECAEVELTVTPRHVGPKSRDAA